MMSHRLPHLWAADCARKLLQCGFLGPASRDFDSQACGKICLKEGLQVRLDPRESTHPTLRPSSMLLCNLQDLSQHEKVTES